MKKAKQKIKEWKDMYKIWRNRPRSTFKQVVDVYTKEPILRRAFSEAHEMLKRDMYMFNEVCTTLLSKHSFRGGHSKLVDVIVKEDERINDYEARIRKELLKYLAENSAPDVESALVLTSVIIDLERLGDYTKDLARLTLYQPLKMEDNEYTKTIKGYKKDIMKMFVLSIDSFGSLDKEKAKQVFSINRGLRKSTDRLLEKLHKDESMRPSRIITYTLYTRYFRRVAAHLENISSRAVKSFPYLGFKGEEPTRKMAAKKKKKPKKKRKS